MPQHRSAEEPDVSTRLKRLVETARRGFTEFLKVPVLIVAGFLGLAIVTSLLDFAKIGWLQPLRHTMRIYIFRDGPATSDLLSTVASSMITVTSITFSLLLLAVQQAASALTHQVYDQFLRRKVNQVYFGFFVGLAVYTLTILATVHEGFNPVFGATLALVLTIVALMLLILLLYTTINQMRPVVVIEAIHDFTLAARNCQLTWLGKTTRQARSTAVGGVPVRAPSQGYIVGIDVDAIAAAAIKAQGQVILRVAIGTYVAFQDVLADIHAESIQDAAEIAYAAQCGFRIEQQRDLVSDPAYGIEQLAIIGWTSVSTAKSNPSPGLLVIHSLRDLLARWSADANSAAPRDEQTLPVIYPDDVFAKLLDAFETMTVVASESMQPQTLSEVLRTFTFTFDRLPVEVQQRAEDLILRSLTAMGEHVLTAELNGTLAGLIDTLNRSGRYETAAKVEMAREQLSQSVGKLAARSTRVTGGTK
jgi:uncharacterized membrane protein